MRKERQEIASSKTPCNRYLKPSKVGRSLDPTGSFDSFYTPSSIQARKKERLESLFKEGRKFETIKYHYEENKAHDSPWKHITEFILNCDTSKIREQKLDHKFPFFYEDASKGWCSRKLHKNSKMKPLVSQKSAVMGGIHSPLENIEREVF